MSTNIEQSLFRCAVDEEFRAIVAANPEAFGLALADLPACLESPELGLADISMAGADVYACNSTCSWGMTIVCDKFTN